MTIKTKKSKIDPFKYTYNKNGDITHKTCTQCGERKALEYFNVKKDNLTEGRNPVCKKCRS